MTAWQRITLSATMLTLMVVAGCHNSNPSYLPLNPGVRSVYRMWGKSRDAQKPEVSLDGLTYAATILPPRTLEGRQVIPQMNDVNGHLAFGYMMMQPNGVYTVARQQLDEMAIETLREPSCVLPLPLLRNLTCDVTLTESASGAAFHLTGTATVEGLEEVVTVPAGTYRHCVKLTSEMSGSARVEGLRATLEAHTIEWFAPDVGLVKSIAWVSSTPRWVGWASRTAELTAFSSG